VFHKEKSSFEKRLAFPFLWRFFFCLSILGMYRLPGQVAVLTANYNNARTNATSNETVLNTLNVNTAQFGKLFTLPVNGYIQAQPLYVQGVGIPGKGNHNVVYVATHHNDVYAFDADAAADALWHLNLGPSVPASDYELDDLKEVGILSTPVIDTSTNTLYAVAHTKENGSYHYRLHALDITSGDERFGGPTEIGATVRGTSYFDGQTGQVAFVPQSHLQRPGLLLSNNVVYIGFGSHDDNGIWHGWLFAYNAGDIQQQVSALNLSPDGWGASTWQGGRGPAADAQGNIYVSTGNGTWDGNNNWGESFLKLDPSSGVLRVADWFTPDSWSTLNDLDNDLGSCGPVLTSSGMLIGGGKEGVVYLMNPANLGHLQSGNRQIPQSFPAIGYGIFTLAYWERPGSPVLYLRSYNDAVKAFRMTNGRFETKPFSQSAFKPGEPFDGMAVSSNGGVPFSAVLWVAATNAGLQNGPGTLHAIQASDVSKELWNSDMNAPADGLGMLAKYVPPTVANGKVYMATFANKLVVYGLRTQTKLVGDVVNSASGLGGTIAPGELVRVYGTGLGPSKLAAAAPPAGHLGTNLGGTQVFINGTAAPLVYARADQVLAVVPFAVSGQQLAHIQVQYQNKTTPPFTTLVADTMPGLYTLDGTGVGQGAILNEDTSLNTPANPADRGGIVVLWATGQGLTDPDWAEDALASDPLPKPLKPVQVIIGGQPAEILYAGAAPGMAGVIQINVRVPSGVKPGTAVPVRVTIGTAPSQPGVTLAVK